MESTSGDTVANSVMRRRLCEGDVEGEGEAERGRLSIDFGGETVSRFV